MSVPSIDVLVPGLEGEWLVRALLDKGLPARRRAGSSAPPAAEPCRLIVLGVGPDEDPFPALAELRRQQDGDPPPILLVGGAPLDLGVATQHGVVAMLDRPASVARILGEVERLLSRAGEGGREASVVLWQGEREREGAGEGGPGSSPRRTQVLAFEGGRAQASTAPPPPRLSGRLTELLRAADRRLFPEAEELDLSFGSGDEPASASALVPDEVLFAPAGSGKGGDLDPVDDPTFLGEAALLAGDSAALRTPSAPALPETSPERPESVRPEAGASDAPRRRTSWPPPREVFSEGYPGGVGLRALWEIGQRPGSWSLLVASPAEPRIELGLRDGQLVSLEAPAWADAGRSLGHTVPGAYPDGLEEEMRRSLLARVEAGTLSAYSLDGALRRAREAALHRILTAPGLRWEAQPGEELAEAGRPIVAADSVGLLFEAARRRLGAEEVAAWLGGPGVALSLTNTTVPRLVAARVEPELAAFLERHQGEALGDVLGRLEPSVGLPGVVYALHVTGALDIVPAGGRLLRPEPAQVEALLRASHRLALAGDYFAILGLDPPASAREVQSAYASRRDAVTALALPHAGRPHLERVRDEVLESLDEARAVLGDDRLRVAYAAALAPPS